MSFLKKSGPVAGGQFSFRTVFLAVAVLGFGLGRVVAKELPPLPAVEVFEQGKLKAAVRGTNVVLRSMSLPQVLARATEVSPDLKTAKLEIDRMTGQLNGVRMKYYPEFVLKSEFPRRQRFYEKRDGVMYLDRSDSDPVFGVQMQEHLPSNTDINAAYSTDTTIRGIRGEELSIEFSQELLRKDPIWKEHSVFTKLLWLEREAAAAVDREFHYQIKSAYYAVVEATLLLANAEERYKQDKLYAEESEKKFTAGIIAEYMVLDYRRDYEQSQSRLVVRRSALDRARNELLYLLQLPFDSTVRFLEVSEPGVDLRQIDRVRMIDARMRSELRIAQLRFNLFSNAENLSYLKNSLLPSVRLRAGGDWFNSHDKAGTTADIESRELSAGVLVTFPLFRDTFTKANNITLEKIDREINEITLTDRFRELVRDVRNDLTAVADLCERHEIAERIHKISNRDYELARLRFEVGNVGSWDMIRSKNEYFGALDDLITLRYALLRRLAAMERDYPAFEIPKVNPKKAAVRKAETKADLKAKKAESLKAAPPKIRPAKTALATNAPPQVEPKK